MSDPAELIGRTISGRYRIDAPIASGGMGAVFRGEHLHMRKRVAIKVLHAGTEGIDLLAAQFEREAIAGAHISHPNVAIATDFGELDDGSYFLILEYLRGVTLSDVIEKGPLSVERATFIARQIAAALQAVHEMGIVHRDVKSSNIMLIDGDNEQAKLIDFGFAKVPMERVSLAGDDDPLSRDDVDPDTVFGTIHYLAPEAARGNDALDSRSDLYALGVIMYEMLLGSRPFDADDNREIFRMHRAEPPPPFVERAPMIPVPAAIEAVVMRLLDKDPDARFQSGDDVIAALDRVAAAQPRKFPRQQVIDTTDIVIAPQRRSRMGRFMLLLLVVGIAGGVVWYVPEVRDQLRQWGVPIPAMAGDEADPLPTKVEVDGLGAAAWTARLLSAPKAKGWPDGAKALAALSELDPTALKADAVAKAAADVAVGAVGMPAKDPTADKVFESLMHNFGSDGLDVLYRIVDSKPKTHPAAKRAFAELRQPAQIARSSPALRVTIELRDAPCEKQGALFGRAATDGDARTLKVIKPLKSKPCRRADHPCCFRKNTALAGAIKKLTATASEGTP